MLWELKLRAKLRENDIVQKKTIRNSRDRENPFIIVFVIGLASKVYSFSNLFCMQ